MKRPALSFRTLFLALALALPGACGDDHPDDDDLSEEELEGLRQCCYLGEVCHIEATTVQKIRDCHGIGHAGDINECRAQFDSCLAACDPEGTSTLPDSCEDPTDTPHQEESEH